MKRRNALVLAVTLLFAAACGDRSVQHPTAPADPVVSSSGSLTVSISGQYYIQPYVDCTWEAHVSGGTAPYTYTWTMSGGSGYGWWNYFTGAANGLGIYRVGVDVEDAVGRKGNAVFNGEVTWNTYMCPW